MKLPFAHRLILLFAISAPAIASAQSGRSSHVIIATVKRLPDDGTVAVLKRFADPTQKDVIFLDSRDNDKKALIFALAALRHFRFTTPNPEVDATIALQSAKSASASTPADDPVNNNRGKKMDMILADLSVKNSLSPPRELPDAFLR